MSAPQPVHEMTHAELQDAIALAHSMVRQTAQREPAYQSLLTHLQALLKVQQQRAAITHFTGTEGAAA